MRALIFIGVVILLGACASKKESVSEKSFEKKTEDIYQSRYKEKYYSLKDSLANVAAPKEQSVTKGLLDSYLFTSLAESRAWIDSLGILNHTINNKDSIPVKHIIEKVKVLETDTLYINKIDTLYVEVDKEIVVTKEPSIIQRVKDASLISLVLIVLFFYVKRWIKGK